MTASHGVGRKPGDGKAQHQCIASPSVTPPGLHLILLHSGGCARRGLRPLRGLRPPRLRAYPRLVFFHPLRGLKIPRAFSPTNSNLLVSFEFLEVPNCQSSIVNRQFSSPIRRRRFSLRSRMTCSSVAPRESSMWLVMAKATSASPAKAWASPDWAMAWAMRI